MVESRLSRMSAALLNMIKEKLTKSSLKVTIQERRQKEGKAGRQPGRQEGGREDWRVVVRQPGSEDGRRDGDSQTGRLARKGRRVGSEKKGEQQVGG